MSTGVINSSTLILNHYHSKRITPMLLQKMLMLLRDLPATVRRGFFILFYILHPFRDSLIPSGTTLQSNPLNLQLTMQATLIRNNKWAQIIPQIEPLSKTSQTRVFFLRYVFINISVCDISRVCA